MLSVYNRVNYQVLFFFFLSFPHHIIVNTCIYNKRKYFKFHSFNSVLMSAVMIFTAPQLHTIHNFIFHYHILEWKGNGKMPYLFSLNYMMYLYHFWILLLGAPTCLCGRCKMYQVYYLYSLLIQLLGWLMNFLPGVKFFNNIWTMTGWGSWLHALLAQFP